MKKDRQKRNPIHAFTEPYRGTLAENCLRFRFEGSGYDAMPPEQDRHIWLSSARHLTGPFLALLDSLVRLVHIIGATQVLKSVAGDAWVVYVVEHICRSMLVLFEDEGKADLYCARRLMETLRKHPEISKSLQSSMKESRHNVTGTWIKTAMMELLVAGMNDGNVSSLPWEFLWISEAWIHGNDGLLWKAYKRTDRFPDTHKILCESQASMAGSDLHVSAREAHQVPLTWKCPACDGIQTWEWQHWNHKRPADFIPRTPKFSGIEIPNPGSYAGMKIPDDGGGTRSVVNRAKAAHWECIWCGYHIEDNRANRQQLMDSYEQKYKKSTMQSDGIPNRESGGQSGLVNSARIQIENHSGGDIKNGIVHHAVEDTPSKITFTLPFESARDNRFASTVESFLIAKHEERQGNKVKLANWFMADRAIFFAEEMLQPEIIQVTTNIDLTQKIPNWHHDGMTVDCQKDKILDTVGTFHWSIDSADKNGNSFEPIRGFAESWPELVATQKKYKIPNRYVNMDGRKWTSEILRQAAVNRELCDGMQYGKPIKFWSCWNILLGDAPARQYRWKDGIYRVWSEPTVRREFVTDDKGVKFAVFVFMYRWSNLSVKDLLHEILIGGEGKPKFTAAPRESLAANDQLMEVGDMAYDTQMSSEMRTEINGKSAWVKVDKTDKSVGNRPNHRWDIACMRLVRLLRENLIGYVASPEETK